MVVFLWAVSIEPKPYPLFIAFEDSDIYATDFPKFKFKEVRIFILELELRSSKSLI